MAERRSSSLQGKWPGRLLDAGFIPVSRIFLRNCHRLDPRLTHTEILFLIDLIDYKWGDKPAFPSWTRIAHDLGLSLDEVIALINSLTLKGYIEAVTLDEKNSSGLGYSFDGLFEKLEQLVTEKRAWIGKKDGDENATP